jgi:hypothetical protein
LSSSSTGGQKWQWDTGDNEATCPARGYVWSPTWVGPGDGMITTIEDCQTAAAATEIGFVAQAQTNWHAGCIVQDNGGGKGAYFVPYDSTAGTHGDASNEGCLAGARGIWFQGVRLSPPHFFPPAAL